MDYQKTFIDMIANSLPAEEKLVDFISKLINLGKEASYRRIRGEVEFTLTELVIIAKKLNINLTSLILREGGEKTIFNLRLQQESDPYSSYTKTIDAALNVFEGLDKRLGTTHYFACRSIPDVFLAQYPNLCKLQLLKIQFNADGIPPSRLADIIMPQKLLKKQAQYWEELKDIDLVYILAPNLFASTISDILFFYELSLISEEERKALKDELFSLIHDLDETARSGFFRNKELQLYVSHVILDLSHSLIESKIMDASVINLHFPNSLLSFDREVCLAHKKRMQLIKKCSSLISQSGEPAKKKFLATQRAFIEQL